MNNVAVEIFFQFFRSVRLAAAAHTVDCDNQIGLRFEQRIYAVDNIEQTEKISSHHPVRGKIIQSVSHRVTLYGIIRRFVFVYEFFNSQIRQIYFSDAALLGKNFQLSVKSFAACAFCAAFDEHFPQRLDIFTRRDERSQVDAGEICGNILDKLLLEGNGLHAFDFLFQRICRRKVVVVSVRAAVLALIEHFYKILRPHKRIFSVCKQQIVGYHRI